MRNYFLDFDLYWNKTFWTWIKFVLDLDGIRFQLGQNLNNGICFWAKAE